MPHGVLRGRRVLEGSRPYPACPSGHAGPAVHPRGKTSPGPDRELEIGWLVHPLSKSLLWNRAPLWLASHGGVVLWLNG